MLFQSRSICLRRAAREPWALPVLPPLLSSSWTSLLQWSVGAAADLVWIHVQINLCKYSQLICVVLVQDNLLSRFRTATVTLKTVRRPGVHFALVDPFHTLRRELSPSCVETMLFAPQYINSTISPTTLKLNFCWNISPCPCPCLWHLRASRS